LNISPDARFGIARCLGCGFIYAEVEPDAAFLGRVYDDVIKHDANRTANENAASFAHRMRYVADLLDLAPPGVRLVALDYGCGLGITLRLLDVAGARSSGFELSSIRIGYASRPSARVVGVRDELRAGSPFDIIVCDNVLEHLPDPVDAMKFLASVAAPGAVLYVSVPDCDDRFVEAQGRAYRAGEPLDMSLNPWEHLNYFDLAHLDLMLGSAGFLPIPELKLAGEVSIGLRRDAGVMRRAKNACATALRLVRYAVTGRASRSPNRAFYRFAG
jgi:SAM-dependent methyltransferase